jgi:CheY-like chemotaxis protein
MCHILLVEDDDGIRQMVRDVLGDEGYAVEIAVEGQAALSYLQGCKQLPQLILLDLVMPGMDGLQFLQVQQNDPRLTNVPVLLFSAASALEQVARTFSAAYFPKPFDVTTLLTMVNHYVARQSDILTPA